MSVDAYDLACHLCKLNLDADYDDVDAGLADAYGLDIDTFHKLISDLLPLIDVGVSPITGTKFKGFSKVENGHGFWLVKMEASHERSN